MPIDTYGLRTGMEHDVAQPRYAASEKCRHPPSCVNVENVTLTFAVVPISYAAFLIPSHGWSL